MNRSLAFQWIGPVEKILPGYNGMTNFYRHSIWNGIELQIGDFILCNGDADDENSCDIGCILQMTDCLGRKPQIKIEIEWYTRSYLMDKQFLKNFNGDLTKYDILKDERYKFESIDVDDIIGKCNVIFNDDDINYLKMSPKTYICRYKIMKIQNSTRYTIVPLEQYSGSQKQQENIKDKKSTNLTPKLKKLTINNHENKHLTPKKSIKNVLKTSPPKEIFEACLVLDKLNLKDITNSPRKVEKTVSPIKIIKNSVYKVNEVTRCLFTDNNKVIPPSTPVRGIKKSDAENINYSIIQTTNENDLKIKIKKDFRELNEIIPNNEEQHNDITYTPSRRNTRKRSETEYILPDDGILSPNKVKRLNPDNIYSTPVSSTRRKSILKTPGRRLNLDTPKRRITLSRVVNVHKYDRNNKSIDSTSSDSSQSSIDNRNGSDFEEELHNKHQKKRTPRRLSVNSIKPVDNKENVRESLKFGEFTPTMSACIRTNTSEKKRLTQLDMAREKLHVSIVPDNLPCRKNEFNDITAFIEGKLYDKCGGCMYVSGVPGTGKTATITEVLRTLNKKLKLGKLPKFECIEINGMRLTEPRQAYVQICRQLTGKLYPWEQAHSILEKRFTSNTNASTKRTSTVLIVDELDILCNKRQDVVYNLLDWPTKKTAQLIVVAISNTMDVPERLLIGKVTSRLGLTRLTFPPYSHQQLQEVVTARLLGIDGKNKDSTSTFDSEAIQLVARKVASVSGDCRRALDISRRAVEIAAAEHSKNVTMKHVQLALTQMISSTKVQTIRNCSKMERLFLQAVCSEVARTGVEETTIMSVYQQYEDIATLMGERVPNPNLTRQIALKLGSIRLLICDNSRGDMFQKIFLNVTADDIHYALKEN